ncbi:PilT/PilU family type 4a pilus ATPase [Anaerofilum sp. BX8]|uniref:PilT/PilU family type 4a pilus ATPase n=1 Tax=Anaerofilum hominis TaxID=2763016 RepID=A0A923I6F0_9FIRM|nr:PilT/PilU family type 4a pilus ATPase [Anaerofilum hominis]MBC5581155.1 PilT/PilU family type 4a pilus ATPase [Anaerofilum hominis]
MDITVQLKDAVARGASDIFIVAGRPLVYKLSGQLTNVDDTRLLPPDTEEFVRQIYKLAGNRPMDRLLETGDDDFSFAVQGISRFRVSAYKQRSSLAAVVRVITFELPDPAALHIPEQVLKLADRTKGMVLVTGSAGSGKSTTLACMIDRINRTRADHIITLEDPLEYLHSHKTSIVSQRETGSDTESYLAALRGALRQSPDVILLGEMRDYETITVAMTAAETGHLLFSSLHTVGAANTIDRILDVFPPTQQHQIAVQLAMVLQAVVSQQLLPTVDGGLLPAFEIMNVNPAIRNMIRENKIHQIDTVIGSSADEDMISMDTSILNLYRAGKISERTALTYAANPDILAKKLKL